MAEYEKEFEAFLNKNNIEYKIPTKTEYFIARCATFKITYFAV
ncbi:hypothetical protein [uncultured Treponema sp.]|nr:hypothetical protein [uncultured Treponema sp.]